MEVSDVMEVVAVEVRSKAKANVIIAASLAIKLKIAESRRSKVQEGSRKEMEVEKFLALEAVAAAVKEAKKQGSPTSVKRLDI